MNKLLIITLMVTSSSLLNSKNAIHKTTTATADVDGITYKAILNGDQSVSIKAGNKTIFRKLRADLYIAYEPYVNMAFEDFNGDGYKDLVIAYNSNVPEKRDLILYNKKIKKFVLVPDFPAYPASTRIPNTDFFYSYHKSGCADNDWDSDLFKIENDKIIRLGILSGRGCGNADDKPGIYIYKVKGKKELLFNQLSIIELGRSNNDKMRFIVNYWKINYAHFQ